MLSNKCCFRVDTVLNKIIVMTGWGTNQNQVLKCHGRIKQFIYSLSVFEIFQPIRPSQDKMCQYQVPDS